MCLCVCTFVCVCVCVCVCVYVCVCACVCTSYVCVGPSKASPNGPGQSGKALLQSSEGIDG